MSNQLSGSPLRQSSSEDLEGCVRGAYLSRGDLGIVLTRLPEQAIRQSAFEPMVGIAARQASGARLEFETSASLIELTVRLTLSHFEWHERPEAAFFVLTADDGSESVVQADEGRVHKYTAGIEDHLLDGPTTTVGFRLPPARGVRRVTIWLPHMAAVELIALRADALLRPADHDRLAWVHYGSSISQGNGASLPTRTWPALVSRRLSLDLTNMALAGQAHLDQFAARGIRDRPADVISLELGINVINGASMRARAFESAVHGFLDTVRDGHPDTTVVVISPIHCPGHEVLAGPTRYENGKAIGSAPDPGVDEGVLTLRRIRTILDRVVRVRRPSDRALFSVNGLDLLGELEADRLPDGLHPDDLGFRRMADRFSRHFETTLLSSRLPDNLLLPPD